MAKKTIIPDRHITTEIVEVEKPKLPKDWDYNKSVKKVKGLLISWRNITGDILWELWIPRDFTSRRYIRDGTLVPSWQQYCKDIGLHKRTANRWLTPWGGKNFFFGYTTLILISIMILPPLLPMNTPIAVMTER